MRLFVALGLALCLRLSDASTTISNIGTTDGKGETIEDAVEEGKESAVGAVAAAAAAAALPYRLRTCVCSHEHTKWRPGDKIRMLGGEGGVTSKRQEVESACCCPTSGWIKDPDEK